MNNKEFAHFFGTMETKRVLNVDYPIESSSLVGPIPIKKNTDLNLLQDKGFELFDTSNDYIQNHILVNNTDQNLFTNNDTACIGRSNNKSFIKMDEDILQVDQPNLLHGPTLTELNAYDCELEDINLDDLLPLDSEISEIPDISMSSNLIHHVENTSPVSLPSSSIRENLSSSVPTHLGFNHIWQHREPRQHLLSSGSLAEAGSSSSLSTGGVLTPETYDFSFDETNGDSNTDTEQEEAYSFDIDLGGSDCGRTTAKSSSYEDRYFWQYNARPKGQRLVLNREGKDPHHLNEVTDPVFSSNCPIKGIQYSGKARKGLANDLTPNPKKLLLIGNELDTLNKSLTELRELSFDVRQNKHKDKMKLVSRVCRLKKKAQHEANKIKHCGIKTEHERLRNAIAEIKQLFLKQSHGLSNASEAIVKNATRLKVAGNTTQFVNKVLEKTKLGVPRGGLDKL